MPQAWAVAVQSLLPAGEQQVSGCIRGLTHYKVGRIEACLCHEHAVQIPGHKETQRSQGQYNAKLPALHEVLQICQRETPWVSMPNL